MRGKIHKAESSIARNIRSSKREYKPFSYLRAINLLENSTRSNFRTSHRGILSSYTVRSHKSTAIAIENELQLGRVSSSTSVIIYNNYSPSILTRRFSHDMIKPVLRLGNQKILYLQGVRNSYIVLRFKRLMIYLSP